MSCSVCPYFFSVALFALLSAFSSRAQAAHIDPELKLNAAAEVLQQLDAGAADVEVIISLVEPFGKPGGKDWDSMLKVRQWQAAIHTGRDEVLARLAPDDFKPRHLFENQSGFSGRVTRKGLANLARDPRVISIQYSRPVEPKLRQGLPLMNALATRANYGGAGVSIAIVDTGVDYRHPDLSLGGTNFPNGKVIGGYDVGDSDPNPLPTSVAHGTACAGIAAGNISTNGDYIGGVAPQAKLYALKITSGLSDSASDADIIAAWDWCITHKNDDPNNPILVISTSFGGGRFNHVCDGDASGYATAAANVASAGITLVVASGNEGYCDSLAMPACISSVIAVGAVFDAAYGTVGWCLERTSCAAVSGPCGMGNRVATDVTAADRVTSYSNTADFLGLLAPSHRTHTTDMIGAGGYSANSYTLDFGGTSASTPYVAGAVAVLQSAARSSLGRYLTVAEVRALLANTGDLISDVKAPQITKPRVNLGRAIGTLTPPRLSATRAGDRVLVSWPTNGTASAVLEWTHSLPALTWSNVPALPVVVGTNRYVTNTVLPGATKFFRLRQ